MSGTLNILIASLGGASSAGLLGLLTATGTTPRLAIENDELYAVVNSSGFIVLKLTLSLGITWQKFLVISESACIATDSSGNVIAGGNNLNSTVPNGYVVKYDSSGNVQWQRQIDGRVPFKGIAVDSADNIYCTGYSNLVSADTDIYIAKFDPSGTLQYQRNLIPNFGLTEFVEGIAITSPTDFTVIGSRASVNRAFFIISDQATATSISGTQTVSSTGLRRGKAIIGGEATGVAYSLIDPYATSSTSSQTVQVLIRSVNGVFSWESGLYPAAGSIKGEALCMNPSGTHIYTVATWENALNELQLCKYVASTGALVWQRTLRSTGTGIQPTSVAVDSFDNVYAFSTISGSSLVLKVPGDGSGVGGSASLGGFTFNYLQTTHTAAVGGLAVTLYDGIGSFSTSPTILTPAGVPTDSTLTMTTASL
jgi:hypothetical protein